MLQKMRDQTQSTGFKILVGAIIAVLVLFGFGATNLFLGSDPEVASVGGVEITQNQLAAATERERRRLIAQMGPDFDPSTIDLLQLQQYVLQQEIGRQVLFQVTKELGVQVAPEQVDEQLLENPNYQVDGVFNEPLYRQAVASLGYTPADFVIAFGDALSSEQLRTGLQNSGVVTDWELGEIVAVVNQKRDVAYLPLLVDDFVNESEVSEEDVTLRYEEDQASYMTELAVDVEYLSLAVDDLLDEPSIAVDEQALLDAYEDDKAAATLGEQRSSAHILLQVNEQRSEKEALDLITEIATRIGEGESFAALAEEFSEDPGSAANGGSLDAVGKGVFDPAFEEALWSLNEPGEISTPVLSSFGYHLIRLDEITVPEYPAFDTQRASLERRLRREQAQELFDDRSLALERAAYDEQFALTQTAADLDLSLVVVNSVSRSDTQGDAVLSNPNVLDAAFGDAVLGGENSEPVAIGEEQLVVVRVVNQQPPEPIPLADVQAQIRRTIADERAQIEIENAKNGALSRLQAGESVTEVAQSVGSRWQSYELVGRSDISRGIPAQVLQAAFDLARPAAGDKSVGEATLADGTALVTVTRVVPGDVGTTTDAELQAIRQQVVARSSRLDFASFFQAAEESLGVSRAVSD